MESQELLESAVNFILSKYNLSKINVQVYIIKVAKLSQVHKLLAKFRTAPENNKIRLCL